MTDFKHRARELQYRVGATGEFNDVNWNGRPVRYIAQTQGHIQKFGPITLPAAVDGQPYVQLRWKYYHILGSDGPRAKLRLDDIVVSGNHSPVIRIDSAVLRPDGFHFVLSGSKGATYQLEVSSDLISWRELASLTSQSGVLDFRDVQAPGDRIRFYRIRSP